MTVLRNVNRQLHRRLIEATTDRERGDVPGWVLITLMTAGLVTALWQFAQPQLTSLFDNAIHGVSGGK
ncbi:hypothetical protein [Yimella sp. cx-51]|uniref:hypothetical protein n=1 Tax=Yimella sp. cx-51 TaxID=2770551 RepID=UPI00165E71FB|nr:hypothetical protein [Yimella sp. cx-51]MBC9956101.1 hypothetical protein [Yimella sp. cx-51]QTH37369.1 hypothetical protein J5M86_10825 [Yimella sp. cx-51]